MSVYLINVEELGFTDLHDIEGLKAELRQHFCAYNELCSEIDRTIGVLDRQREERQQREVRRRRARAELEEIEAIDTKEKESTLVEDMMRRLGEKARAMKRSSD